MMARTTSPRPVTPADHQDLIDTIADNIRAAMHRCYHHEPGLTDYHVSFATAVANKDCIALEYICNGANTVALAVFTAATGVKMPKTEAAMMRTLYRWAGKSKLWIEDRAAILKLKLEREIATQRMSQGQVRPERIPLVFAKVQELYEQGFTQIVKEGRQCWFSKPGERLGMNLSAKETELGFMRGYIEAFIAARGTSALLANEVELQRRAQLTQLARSTAGTLSGLSLFL